MYGIGNLKDITPSFVFVTNIFVSVCKSLGFQDFVVVPYLIERWNAKKVANQFKASHTNANIGELDDEQIRIQNNLTQKFIRTFLRVVHHRNDIEVFNYPLEGDFNMNLKVTDMFDKEINNSLLRESDDIITGKFNSNK